MFRRFSNVFRCHLFVFLLFTCSTRMMIYVRTRDTSQVALRVANRTLFNEYNFTFRVCFFNDSMDRQILLAKFRTSFSQRLNNGNNGLIRTINVCMSKLRITRNGTNFLTSKVLNSRVLMNFCNAIVIVILMMGRASFNNNFATSKTFKMFNGRLTRNNSDLTTIITLCMKTSLLMRNVSNMKQIKVFNYGSIRRTRLFHVIFLRTVCRYWLVSNVISNKDIRILNFNMMLLNFLRATSIRIAIASTIMNVYRYNQIFTFLRLSGITRAILYHQVIFLIRDSMTRIVMNGNGRFHVPLPNR